MKDQDLLWFITSVACGGGAVILIETAVTPSERGLPLLIIILQTVATMLWIWRSSVVERKQFAMLRDRRTAVSGEHLRSAIDTIESTQAAASNSLIATGIILSAIVLIHNAARFVDPKANASELLAVAPKAFTATGFGLLCGLLLMVRAHFGALQQLSAIRPAASRADERQAATAPADAFPALHSVAHDLRTIVAAMESEQNERQQSATELRKAVEEVATLVSETRKQLPKSALGRLASSTEQFSKDVEAVCTAIVDLRSVLETQAESVRDVSRKELHDALTSQAAASLDAFREKLLSGFGQRMEQLAGHVEQRVEHIVNAAQESVDVWRPELETTLNRLSSSIERKSEEAFREVREQADGYLERRVDEVLNDARLAERQLGGVVDHLREINQSLSLLLSGLTETEATLKTFAPNGSGTEGTATVHSFLKEMEHLAETVDRVGLRFLYELEALEAKRETVRSLRTQITEVLAESSN